MPATRHDVDRKHDSTHNNTHTRRALVLEVQQPDSASIWPGKAAAITSSERTPRASPVAGVKTHGRDGHGTPVAGVQHTEAFDQVSGKRRGKPGAPKNRQRVFSFKHALQRRTRGLFPTHHKLPSLAHSATRPLINRCIFGAKGCCGELHKFATQFPCLCMWPLVKLLEHDVS